MVDREALAAQQHVQSSVAEATTLGRERAQPAPQLRHLAPATDVATGRAVHAHEAARTALAERELVAELRHRRAPHRGASPFFCDHRLERRVVERQIRDDVLEVFISSSVKYWEDSHVRWSSFPGSGQTAACSKPRLEPAGWRALALTWSTSAVRAGREPGYVRELVFRIGERA